MLTNIKRLVSFTTVFVLSFSALAVIVPSKALAATRTWDGGGVDNNWSTAANWSGDTAPVDGDVVVFDTSVAGSYGEELNNDIDNLDLAGINIVGDHENDVGFAITGKAITLSGPIDGASDRGSISLKVDITLGSDVTISTHSVAFNSAELDLQSHQLTVNYPDFAETCGLLISNSLKGSGNISVTAGRVGLRSSANSYTGNITVAAGTLLVAENALSGSTTVTMNGSSLLQLAAPSDATFPVNVVMNSSGDPALLTAQGTSFCSGGLGDKTTSTLSGSLTLGRNTIFTGVNNLHVTGTYTTNGHTLSISSGSAGSVTTSAGIIETEAKTVTIAADDKQPNKSESIGNKQTFIIDGERGTVSVHDGGTLKGIGTVQGISAWSGSKVAPGHSPGRLTVLETLNFEEGSVYEAELKSIDEYDQLVVGENYTGGGNAVSLWNATLEGIISDGFSIKASDTFTIINNLSETDVQGTFKDLPEGATFKISDGVFKITYVGGDGNDVVLSVITVPTAPNSGFRLLFASPYAVLLTTIAVAGAAFYLSRRYVSAKAKA